MDRLKELKRGAPVPQEDPDDYSDRVGLVNKAKNSSSSSDSRADSMQEFFGDVEIVKSNILVIKESTRKLGEINQNVMQATTSDKEAESGQDLEPLIKSTNKKATIAKQLLQRIREDTQRLKSNSSTGTSPEIRIRENMVSTLTRKFVDVMKDYQNAQSKYKNDIKKKVKRQVQIVKPDATTDEIDAVFKSGGGSGDVLKQAILKGGASESIQNAYMNVADKYQDVLTLEASVAELHQMFLDFALLTEKQGELLDQIEHNVKEADEYIEDANKNLTEAIDLQKSIWVKRCIIIFIILAIIGILVGVIAAEVHN